MVPSVVYRASERTTLRTSKSAATLAGIVDIAKVETFAERDGTVKTRALAEEQFRTANGASGPMFRSPIMIALVQQTWSSLFCFRQQGH